MNYVIMLNTLTLRQDGDRRCLFILGEAWHLE